MTTLRVILMVLSMLCFGLATLGPDSKFGTVRLNLIAGGLFCWSLTQVLPLK